MKKSMKCMMSTLLVIPFLLINYADATQYRRIDMEGWTKIYDSWNLKDNDDLFYNFDEGAGGKPYKSSGNYKGDYSLGFPVVPSSSGKDRTEYNLASNYGQSNSTGIPFNQDRWTGFAMRLGHADPSSFQIPNSWFVLAQWWQWSDAEAPMAMQVDFDGSTLKGVRVTARNDANTSEGSDGKIRGGEQIGSTSIGKNQWKEFIFYHKFSYNGDGKSGKIEAWKNGSRFINKPNYDVGYNPNQAGANPYIDGKFGIYRNDMNKRQKVFFDQVKYANTGGDANP